MDINHLNKSQLILLTLFVSFVTSIATGIVTVSLMQQAPPVITQTVNKVIEHTIEKAVPGQSASAAASTQLPTTKTVVVTQADTVAQAVDHASDSIVRLSTADSASATFLALGIVIDDAGMVVTDAAALGDAATVQASVSGGTPVRMFVISRNESGLAYLAPATTTASSVRWDPLDMTTSHATLGNTAIVLGGKMSTRVSVGIVTALERLSDSASSSPQVIDTDIAASAIIPGAPLLDSSGALVGISTEGSRGVSQQGFVSSLSISPPKN